MLVSDSIIVIDLDLNSSSEKPIRKESYTQTTDIAPSFTLARMTFDDSKQKSFDNSFCIDKEGFPQENLIEEKRKKEGKVVTEERKKEIIPIEEKRELQKEVVEEKENNKSIAEKNELEVDETKNEINEKDFEERPASREFKDNEVTRIFHIVRDFGTNQKNRVEADLKVEYL